MYNVYMMYIYIYIFKIIIFFLNLINNIKQILLII
jgi:hypothetical protein